MKNRVFYAPLVLGVFASLLTPPVASDVDRSRIACLLGHSSLRSSEEATIDPIVALELNLEAKGGRGSVIGCELTGWGGIVLYGEYRKNEGDFNVSLIFDGEKKQESFDLDVTRWRIGLGYDWIIGERGSVYGRIGYAKADYDYETVFIVLDSGGAQFGPASFQSDDGGVDLEAGFRWWLSDRIQIGGFFRFAEDHVLSFNDHAGFSFSQRNSDALIAGPVARFAVTDVISLTAESGFGDIEETTVGIRFEL